MQLLGQTSVDKRRSCTEQPLFAIVCTSGFENEDRVRSALMFASLAASADKGHGADEGKDVDDEVHAF